MHYKASVNIKLCFLFLSFFFFLPFSDFRFYGLVKPPLVPLRQIKLPLPLYARPKKPAHRSHTAKLLTWGRGEEDHYPWDH